MVLHFNVKGESRKAMVKAIEKELGVKARYLGVPSCSYEVGNYTVGRNGELEFADGESMEETAIGRIISNGIIGKNQKYGIL